MENAIAHEGRVLVHCRYGVSRSVALVMCYLMYLKDWSYDETLQYMQVSYHIIFYDMSSSQWSSGHVLVHTQSIFLLSMHKYLS